MKQVYFVSSNKGKAHTMNRVCSAYGIEVIQFSADLHEPQTFDLREIAKEKVLDAYSRVKHPVIAQDTGFYLTAWPGFPGPFVKFAIETIGNPGFLALVEGRDRSCEFRECMAFTNETGEVLLFESVVPGELAFEETKELPAQAWSKLWKIFIPDGQTKTIAEMSETERAAWRDTRGATAADMFAKWYKDR